MLLARLREWKVKQVFAFPGDGINGLLAAWGRAENDPQFVQARHVPVVAIVGQTELSAMGGAYQQEVDLLSLFKDVCSRLHRRTPLVTATIGAIAGLLLFAIGTASLGTPANGHSMLRLWRYQVGDSVLFCVLTAYNFALIIWLVANAIEGPAWVRRHTGAASGHDDAD